MLFTFDSIICSYVMGMYCLFSVMCNSCKKFLNDQRDQQLSLQPDESCAISTGIPNPTDIHEVCTPSSYTTLI